MWKQKCILVEVSKVFIVGNVGFNSGGTGNIGSRSDGTGNVGFMIGG